MNRDKIPYKILVIEDNPGDFIIVEDLLTESIAEPSIQRAVNFKHALIILNSSIFRFDVILLDLSLPDKSGENLVTEILGVVGSCPVIILTGYSDIAFSIKSIGLGIMDYLLKDDLDSTKLYKSLLYSIERKKVNSSLKESEKRYSDLFDLSPQPMWAYDGASLKFIQVNKAALALYGFTEYEFLNMRLIDLKMEDEKFTASEATRNIQDHNPKFKKTEKHYKKSGEIVEVEIYTTPILLNERKCCSVIAIDVTERNQVEHTVIKAIIKTQEDERYEIGGELHDNVCQILAVSQQSLSTLKESLSPAAIPTFDQTRNYIGLALEEIRNLSHRLAPVFFNDSTLEEAFRRLIATFSFGGKCKIFLQVDEDIRNHAIGLDLQLNLYRILQEQLRNIFKYSQATSIEVDVLMYNNKLKMRIADDGIGFNMENMKRGIGLANMKRRTELFSGSFEIITAPGEGFTILIDMPLTDFPRQENIKNPNQSFLVLDH